MERNKIIWLLHKMMYQIRDLCGHVKISDIDQESKEGFCKLIGDRYPKYFWISYRRRC